MQNQHKIIGTSIPLFSLKSSQSKNTLNGTLEDGLLFLKWLRETGQNAWQMLPIHETILIPGTSQNTASPYKGYGMGIDPKYMPVSKNKTDLTSYEKFKTANDFWLTNYSTFCAIRNYFKTDDWRKWDKDIKNRTPESLFKWQNKLKDDIEKLSLLQFQLHTQYKELKEEAAKAKIQLFGDMQFYLPLESPLVWEYQKAFIPIEKGVSGIPNKKGIMYGRQVWGHPLYNWEDNTQIRHITELFIKRLRYLSTLYDMVRIDHASGFFRYGKINTKDSAKDKMEDGPGEKVFEKIIKEAEKAGIRVYAEDAGYELGGLRNIMEKLNIPGIRVLRCAYDNDNDLFINDHAKIHHYKANTVVFTSTHDTEPLYGFLKTLNTLQKQKLAANLETNYSEDIKTMAANLRNIALSSNAKYILIPLQDWFLTDERINIPGTEKNGHDTNWKYRMHWPIEELPLIEIPN